MDYVKELVKLAQLDRPTELPSEDDWRRVEMELEYRLPADYKELISAFGSGDFGIDLGFLNPKATKDVALSKEYLVKYWGVIGWLEDIMDIRLFPNPGGLVTIGTNSNAMDIQLIPNQETKELNGLSILDVVGKQIEYLDMTPAPPPGQGSPSTATPTATMRPGNGPRKQARSAPGTLPTTTSASSPPPTGSTATASRCPTTTSATPTIRFTERSRYPAA